MFRTRGENTLTIIKSAFFVVSKSIPNLACNWPHPIKITFPKLAHVCVLCAENKSLDHEMQAQSNGKEKKQYAYLYHIHQPSYFTCFAFNLKNG